jgi:hypothetical protein
MQGLATKDSGFLVGFAAGGDWMSGHTLVVAKWHSPNQVLPDGKKGTLIKKTPVRVYLDGKRILKRDGNRYSNSVLDLHRYRSKTMKLKQKELDELDPKHIIPRWWWKDRYKEAGKAKYHFILPNGVHVHLTDHTGLDMIIKMPPVDGQEGWCGNFNGKRGDGDVLGEFQKVESFFTSVKKLSLFGASEGSSWNILNPLTWGGSSTATPEKFEEIETIERVLKACSPALKEASNCSHIAEKELRDYCFYDVCFTGDTSMAEDSIGMEILEVKEAKGTIAFDGEGRCLDNDGQLFTVYKTEGQSTAEKCQEVLQSLASTDGVRGAELSPAKECFIVAEPDIDLHSTQIEPGWAYEKSGADGSGIVSRTTETQGWACWKLI